MVYGAARDIEDAALYSPRITTKLAIAIGNSLCQLRPRIIRIAQDPAGG